jgi:hypothetical protein
MHDGATKRRWGGAGRRMPDSARVPRSGGVGVPGPSGVKVERQERVRDGFVRRRNTHQMDERAREEREGAQRMGALSFYRVW